MPSEATLGRILAIEPDSGTALVLKQALGPQIGAELLVVSSVDEALDSISTGTPDLILTTTFLVPADEMKLRDHLRQSPDTAHVQVIALPQLDTTEFPPDTSALGRVLPFRRQGYVPRFNPELLQQHVHEYLQQAHARRLALENSPAHGGSSWLRDVAVRPRDAAAAPSSSADVVLAKPDEVRGLITTGFRLPADRRRALRRRAADLAGQWAIRLAPDGEASILDLSQSGVLLETASWLTPGSIVNLHLRGIEKNLSVTARLLRSEAAVRDGQDVRYRVAAAFSRELDLFVVELPPSAAVASHPPRVLGDLLGRVLADATWASNRTTLCARFEAELAGLLRARAVRIGPITALLAPPDCESRSFDIPGSDNAQLAVHVIFERGYEPTPFDIRLIKTAANLATVIFELAPSARLHSPIN